VIFFIQNNPNSGLVICPFNFTHRIPAAEKDNHVKVCPDQRIFDPDSVLERRAVRSSIKLNNSSSIPREGRHQGDQMSL
jgi:hypothetical protein